LEDDIVATGTLRNKAPKRKSKDNEDNEDNFVDSKASRNILRIGQELIDEDAAASAPRRPPAESSAFAFDSRFEDEEGGGDADFGDEEAWGDEDEEEEIVEEIEVDDLDTFNKFLPTDDDPLLKHGWPGQESEEQEAQSTNLADLILAKIAAHEAGADRGQEVEALEEDYELPEKVVDVYTKYDPSPEILFYSY
jgi:essential nuclear protein 1